MKYLLSYKVCYKLMNKFLETERVYCGLYLHIGYYNLILNYAKPRAEIM